MDNHKVQQASREYKNLQHFYINEEQSFYLLSHRDAQKLKDWLDLCKSQLARLGYSDIELIGRGAYGFVFGGKGANGKDYVFKFARITLPKHVQERLEDEGYMLSQLSLSHIPAFVEFQRVRGQSILMMERARGINLQQLILNRGRVSPRLLLKIAAQFAEILLAMREDAEKKHSSPMIHGDIKPSNVVFDEEAETIGLIDWGAAVYAQQDAQRHFTNAGGLSALSSDVQETNAKLGDIYFIGVEQLGGALSSPRFDEQGVAGTLYALASGQSSRFGSRVITPRSLGLPIEFARTLEGMLSDEQRLRDQAGDYFLNNMRFMKNIATQGHSAQGSARPGLNPIQGEEPLAPVWLSGEAQDINTVVYSSRKSFLCREMPEKMVADVDLTELDRYYKNYLEGMGDTEKAFIIAVGHLGNYPLVGGLAIHWDDGGMYIDSSLNLYDESLLPAFVSAVNNMVHLGRAINKTGVFKSCIFDARKTLHVERDDLDTPFVVEPGMTIPYEVSEERAGNGESRLHSYFEDGEDPDEMLTLPQPIRNKLTLMNTIRHTGCIIFESLEYDLKIHNYLTLLDPAREPEFRECLEYILDNLHLIDGLGVSGFMKLPHKDTKFFSHQASQPDYFCPRDPRHIS